MKVDLVIKNWNAHEYLRHSLESISLNDRKYIDLLVVDNGSSPSIESLVDEFQGFSSVNIYKFKKNVGTIRAINKGFELTKNKYIVISDNDVSFSSNWLDMISYFNDNRELIAIVPRRISRFERYPWSENTTREEWEKIRFNKGDLEESLKNFIRGKTLVEFNAAITKSNKSQNEYIYFPKFASFSTMVIRRDYVNKIGGLADNDLGLYGGEDVDFCWRAQKNGYKILRCNEVYIHHFEHSSLISNKQDYEELVKSSNKLLYDKWKNDVLISKYKNEIFYKVFKEIEENGKKAFF